jgi:hypothetical protein
MFVCLSGVYDDFRKKEKQKNRTTTTATTFKLPDRDARGKKTSTWVKLNLC